ncbi:PepSY domain-containing protein [Shimia ponticola]|uniref:PepSY domain-containing protein n=1 Tax=Shimia ponticola TaxID=2582893 RepID=UPI00164BBB2E|nr:PepSY domain-containing protein [Shimia ponticola]
MRRVLAIVVCLFAGLAGPVSGETIEEQVIRQLSAQGYSSFETGRTLLGRVRVVGLSDTRRREIVVHPTTGAVLFDNIRALAGERTGVILLNESDDDGPSASGGGAAASSGQEDDRDDDGDRNAGNADGGRDDDDRDDDRDDDDDDDRNDDDDDDDDEDDDGDDDDDD